MNKEELTQLNLGDDLDQLMNLDPRGYGVCRILYKGARDFTGEPLSMHCAKELKKILEPGDIVYIFTGFVLLPNYHAEMDGIVGAMLIARALAKAYEVKPVIICPEENMIAVRNLSPVVGLHLYEDMEELKKFPISIGAISFTKDKVLAETQAKEIYDTLTPKAMIAIEAPGANSKGVFHNAIGKDLSFLECQSEVLFKLGQSKGIWNMAIGDLGNEMGMGAIAEHLQKYVPYMEEDGCICGCGGGSMSAVAADNIMTATVSDWAAYALIAATAYLNHDLEIMHTADLEQDAIKVASNSGMVDMYGWLEYAIDGIAMDFQLNLVSMMRLCVENTFKHENKCNLWFEKVNEKGFFDSKGGYL